MRTRINAAFDGGTSRTVALNTGTGRVRRRLNAINALDAVLVESNAVTDKNDGSAAFKSRLASGDVLVLEEWPWGAVARRPRLDFEGAAAQRVVPSNVSLQSEVSH